MSHVNVCKHGPDGWCVQCSRDVSPQAEIQRLTEELRTVKEERDKLQLAIEISAKPIQYFVDLKAERDALQKRNEKLEAALQQYAEENNWGCSLDSGRHSPAQCDKRTWTGDTSIGEQGPDLAKAALGLGEK